MFFICLILSFLELLNLLVLMLFFNISLRHFWWDVCLFVALILCLILLYDLKRTKDRLTKRYISQYYSDAQHNPDMNPYWPDIRTMTDERQQRQEGGTD